MPNDRSQARTDGGEKIIQTQVSDHRIVYFQQKTNVISFACQLSLGGLGALVGRHDDRVVAPMSAPPEGPPPFSDGGENALAAAVRKLLPVGVADKCRIQVIVQMSEKGQPAEGMPAALAQGHASEHPEECHSDSSH